MKTYLLTILGLLISFPLTARDFSYTYEGNTLIYTVLDENSKTCEVKNGYDASGILTIPETAIDGIHDTPSLQSMNTPLLVIVV